LQAARSSAEQSYSSAPARPNTTTSPTRGYLVKRAARLIPAAGFGSGGRISRLTAPVDSPPPPPR
jgi:hypothetical protein